MNEELSRKVQEQGRMTSAEHKKLFVKEDVNKEQRERIDDAQKNILKKDIWRQDTIRKLEEAKKSLAPLEKVSVNQEFAKEFSKRTERRIRDEIRKGNIPKYDIRKDFQMRRWLKR